MSTTSTLDLEALLAPIAADQPAGIDVRQDDSPESLYRQIKDARKKARRQEDQMVWDEDHSGTPPEWGVVLREAPTLIREQSKDLEVAAWFIEALVREYGFAGLRDGLSLCGRLIDEYWDNLHPHEDPSTPDNSTDVPICVATLEGLNDGSLVTAIKAVSLVDTNDYGSMGLSLYRQATALEKLNSNEQAARLEHGGVSMVMFKQAVSESSAGFFRALLADLEGSRKAFKELYQTVKEKCGRERTPSLSKIKAALDDCHGCVTKISRDILAADMSVDDEGEDGTTTGENGVQGGTRSGPIRSREQAFKVIGELAQFFRRTEPHSVLAWQLEECVRWGKMTLPELLDNIIVDSSTRDQVFKRVGIPPPTK